MDENSCENETSESADGQKDKETSESLDGQKKKETENATELQKAGVNIAYKRKRELNPVSQYGSSYDGPHHVSHDGSGPSTDFSSHMVENVHGEKTMPSLVNIQTVKYTQDEENEIAKKTIKELDKNEPQLNEPLAIFPMEGAEQPEDPSAPVEENVQCHKILSLQQEDGTHASVPIPLGLPGYEEQQDTQPRVRLAPSVEEQLSTRRPSVGPPPSYSFVMKQKKKIKSMPSLDPFVTNAPPPTYSGTRGPFLTPEERVVNFPSFAEPIWRSHSQPALCPRCGIIVLTTTHTHDSLSTHVAALALCLLGCWPCCLIPYCLSVCKNTFHYCPICQTFLGLYKPW